TLVKFHAVPPQIHAAEELRQAHALALWFGVSEDTSRIEQIHKAMDVGMLCEKRPVEPAGFVILAIGIVISKLCSPRFVAHEKHGHTDRKHRYGQEVFYLPVPEFLHSWIMSRTLNTAVPTPIVVRAVPVIFAVCFVVFGVIGDEIIDGEAVMARYKINA